MSEQQPDIVTNEWDPSASSLPDSVDPAVMQELLRIRGSIDNIDATLVYLLAERFKCCLLYTSDAADE